MKQTLALTLLGLALTLGVVPVSAQPQQVAASMSPAADAGTRTCLTCHGSDPKVTAILKSPMAVVGDPRTPFAQGGCVSCHGPSANHIAMKAPFPDIVFAGPHKSSAKDRNEVCLSCHQGNPMVMNWEGSGMQRAGVACTDCHVAHAAKDPVMVKATQPQICFTCHQDIRADTYKYSHHPIREGLVVCSDCHNPMGGPGDTKDLKEFTVNQTCYNCHADKRGPLLWEHQPVRDNCLNCHTPHGSNQPRLMIEPTSFLCSSCHSSEANTSGGAFGGGHGVVAAGPSGGLRPGFNAGSVFFNSAPMSQRGCLNCHSQVHGSNSPAGAFFFR
jgi:DmsE family decaheme c-type cytochrome